MKKLLSYIKNLTKTRKVNTCTSLALTVIPPKECSHSNGCEHVEVKFICTKRGNCNI